MIKYAISIIFLICMTAYEASADSASSDCGKQFGPQSKAPKIPLIEPEDLAGLLRKLNIPTHKQFKALSIKDLKKEAEEWLRQRVRVHKDLKKAYGMKWSEIMGKPWITIVQFRQLLRELGIITTRQFRSDKARLNKKAEDMFGEGVRVPTDPEGTYKMKWLEITGKNWISLKQFRQLLSKLGITTATQFRALSIKVLNKEAEKWLEKKGARVPTDPMKAYDMTWWEVTGRSWITVVQLRKLVLDLGITTITQFKRSNKGDLGKEAERRWGEGSRVPGNLIKAYGVEWPDLISGKFTTKQKKLTDLESLSLDLPGFKEEYLSKDLITKLNFNNKEIEELFDNFQYGMSLLIKKKFRTAFDFLSSAGVRVGNLKLKELIKRVQKELEEHTEKINQNSGFYRGVEEA